MSKRRNYSSKHKTRVARAAIEGNATLAALASRFVVHPILITQWKRKALDHRSDAFDTSRACPTSHDESRIHERHAKIGELTVEQDFSAKAFDRCAGPSVWR